MEIKFFTDKGILDLSEQKISIQENNPALSDKMLTKFMFPFQIYVDDDFLITFGDYISYESWNLEKEIKGKLLFEGKVHDAKLEIISIENKLLEGQIDFGFEDLPNFDKKLSELPLEYLEVTDIHTYAADICKKTYPETNYNFPRIFTKKYDTSQKMWDAFNGYYNNTVGTDDNLVMIGNRLPSENNNWEIDNINIIHPCPHILYLLKLGFKDAGFELAGDILLDKNLENAWVFSGGEYFRNKYILLKEHIVKETEYISKNCSGSPTHCIYDYEKEFIIEHKDKYRFDFNFTANEHAEIKYLKLFLNGSETIVPTNSEKKEFSLTHFIETTTENTTCKIKFQFDRAMRSGPSGGGFRTGIGGTPNAWVPENILSLKIRSTKSYESSNNSDIQETKVVNNENLIDLRRAVPDLTFGELVNIIKNWFNYTLKLNQNTIELNKVISRKPITPKSFNQYEILSPKRTLLAEKSFLVKFEDLDNEIKLDSMLFNNKGNKLNGKEDKNTNIIEIKGYPLPIKKAKAFAPETAYVMKDSDTILSLVGYKGLKDGKNDAIELDGALFPNLLDSWDKWFANRIYGVQYEWKFLANTSKFREYSINDYIYAYNNIHIISSMTKDKIADNTYEVNITTETMPFIPTYNEEENNYTAPEIVWEDNTTDAKIGIENTTLVKLKNLNIDTGSLEYYSFSINYGNGYEEKIRNTEQFTAELRKGVNKIRLEVKLNNGKKLLSNTLIYRKAEAQKDTCNVFIASKNRYHVSYSVTYMDCDGTEKELVAKSNKAFCAKTILNNNGCTIIDTSQECTPGQTYSLEYTVKWTAGFREGGYVKYINSSGTEVTLTIPQNDTNPRTICAREIIERSGNISIQLTGNICS
ncbi:hypothetical protein [Riemerella columbina]|uniref:hypothetical protein n=1 Tax=Riemerella columbina TaxID=103810 RepID=UPI00037EB49C|nr:hypothetical protein [Riemerella columbina]